MPMPLRARVHALVGTSTFLIRSLSVLAICLVVVVALFLLVLVSLLFKGSVIPPAIVAALAGAATFIIIDKREVAVTALGHVESLVADSPNVESQGSQGSTPARGRRDIARSLLNKVIDAIFDSVLPYMAGVPLLALLFAWIAYGTHHGTISFLFVALAIVCSVCGLLPYCVLRAFASRQVDLIVDAIPSSSSSGAASTEATPLLKG
jgi:hypothetical protein